MFNTTATELKDFINNTDEAVATIVKTLIAARLEFAREIEATIGKDEEYRTAIEEGLPNLTLAERAALDALKGLEAQLKDNLASIDMLPYRPKDSKIERDARDRLSHYMALANDLPLDLLLSELDGSLLDDTQADLAAWSLVRPTMEARLRKVTTPEGQKLVSKIRLRVSEMQRATGDPRVQVLRTGTEESLAMVRRQLSILTLQRAAHDPTPGFGSHLLTWRFSQDAGEVAAKNRYNPDALAQRLGVSSLNLASYYLRTSAKRVLG